MELRTAARETVYRKTNFSFRRYGPFETESDKVSWRLLGNIAIVMYSSKSSTFSYRHITNINSDAEDCMSENDDTTLLYPRSFVHTLPTPPRPASILDWAGVEMEWQGNYSFVDFRLHQMFVFSFDRSHHSLIPLHSYNTFGEDEMPAMQDVAEATGESLSMKLKITNMAEMEQSKDQYPTIQFKGISGVAGNARSFRTDILGQVAYSSEGYYLWTWSKHAHDSFWLEADIYSAVAYGGADRWKLTGIQTTHRGGILGLWSDAEEPEEGPTGLVCFDLIDLVELIIRYSPFCYWRTDLLE